MKRKISLLLVISLLFSLASIGCTSQPAQVSDDDQEDSTQTNEEVADVAPKKDSLIIGQYGDAPNLDTNNCLNDNAMRVMTNLYDPLVRMNKDFKPVPSVAEKWEISPDGKEYTFYIKKGIKFHNGDDLTIEDVVFSVKRGMESPQSSPSYARVKDVEKISDDAIKIYLDGPYAELLAALSLPVAGIVSEKAVTELGEEFGRKPVGTGPYKLKDWVTGEKVVLEAFADYHMGEPAIKTVEFRAIEDKSAAVISLEKGDIDAYVSVNESNFERIKASDRLEFHLGEAFSYSYLQLNTTKPPLDNVKVRQAIAHLVDKEGILYGIKDGVGETIDTFAIPKMLGYTDKVKKYDYDIDKAKALLNDAGYPNGFECDFLLYTEASSKIAQMIQASFSEVGIKSNIKLMERSAFDIAAAGGEGHIVVDGATFTAPAIDDAIYDSIHSNSIGIRNYSLYQNPEVDELLDKARIIVDDEERGKIYEEILIKISEDVPEIPLTWNYSNIAADKNLKGIYAHPHSFYYVFDYYWD